AERVLGNVVSSGIKILVLAVIIGIGSTIFNQFTAGFNNPPTISDALTLILAALSLLGLTIFGPGIANGLIAGGPQLGAGAAAGLQESFASGERAAMRGGARPAAGAGGASAAPNSPPAWAQQMGRGQTINRGVTAADHAIRSGDRPSGGHQIDLSEGE